MGKNQLQKMVKRSFGKLLRKRSSSEASTRSSDNNNSMLGKCSVDHHSLKSPFHANEDQILVHQDELVSIFGVMDGHGGQAAAKYVQQEFVQFLYAELQEWGFLPAGNRKSMLEEWLLKLSDSEEVVRKFELCLIATVHKMDHLYCKVARQNRDYSGACMNVVIILQEDHVFCANTGDCRAIQLSSQNGDRNIVQLSMDHKASVPSETKRILRAGGRVVQGRIAGVLEPSRAIGDIDLKQKHMKGWLIATPVVHHARCKDESIFVLATDGVWDVLDNREIDQNMENGDIGAFSIAQLARKSGSDDDISVIVVHCAV